MTAQSNGGEPDTSGEKQMNENNATTNQSEGAGSLPNQILDLFEFLSFNQNIVFKSQQIDDPELERSEKVKIARHLYLENRQKFLERFGGYFERQHLENFTSLALSSAATPLNRHENHEEMLHMIANFTLRLQTRSKDIKNRRFAALQGLIKDGDYFSEREMMKRAPELYQEMIGQYLTEAEKKERDGYDVKNTTFSGILMHTMEQKEMTEILKKADEMNTRRNSDSHLEEADGDGNVSFKTSDQNMIEEEEEDSNGDPKQCASSSPKKMEIDMTSQPEATAAADENVVEEEEDESSDSNEHSNKVRPLYDDYIEEIPPTCRTQWGNFDNEQKACSISTTNKMKIDGNVKSAAGSSHSRTTKSKLITGPERDLLRREFIDIMHERFLTGDDKDFDYSAVDENSQYDDLQQLNQDKEDAYFDESDDESVDEMPASPLDSPKMESEDELDIYMRHLSKHPSLRKT